MIENYKNPLEDYKNFRIYNYETTLKIWGDYLDEGMEILGDFLKSLLPRFNCLSISYTSEWEGLFTPFFVIKVPRSMSYAEQDVIWNKIYDLVMEFSITNNVIIPFRKMNFTLGY